MRWVDPARVIEGLPPEWLDSAREAERQVIEARDDEARKVALKAKDEVWQKAKKYLKLVMNNKCWYCETRDDRSDNAVDHFRPKSFYWWLAFEYTNLRFSCTYCNSRRIDDVGGTAGGKAAEFPISGVLAKGVGSSLDNEKPLLLDPCKEADPEVLWFEDTGMPVISPRSQGLPGAEDKVAESIRLYHLDFVPLTRLRRRKYLDVIDACRKGDKALTISKDEKLLAEYRDEAYKQWWERVAEVNRLIDRLSPHSAAARCAVLGLRASSLTAEQALAMA